MHGEEVEGDGVARLHVERGNLELVAAGIDVRHGIERLALALVIDADELRREKRLSPAVGSHDELQAYRTRHGIERGPEAHGVGSLDAVVGQIVMPRGAGLGPRLLHQHMLVEEPRGAGVHEPSGHPGRG